MWRNCLGRWRGAAASGSSTNMEACFSQLTLDVIGKFRLRFILGFMFRVQTLSCDFGALTWMLMAVGALFCTSSTYMNMGSSGA